MKNTMRGPVRLLKDAWEIFASNPRLFIGIYLVPAIVTFAWPLFVLALEASSIEGPMLLASAIAVLLFLPLIVVVNILMGMAMVKAVADPTSLTPSAAYRSVTPYFWSYIWLATLLTLVTTGGLILLIIPGIIFAIWFSLSYFVLLLEDIRGVEAMKRSKAYVKGKWWAVFGRLMFLIVVGFIVSVVLDFIAHGLASGIENIGRSIVTLLANAVIIPVAVAYSYLLYKDVSSGSGTMAQPTDGQLPE